MVHKIKEVKDNLPAKADKAAIQLAEAVFILFGYPELEPSERRLLLRGMAKLQARVKNKKRFIQYYEQFSDEAQDEGIYLHQLGKYLMKRLQSRRLPKLVKRTYPAVSAADCL